MEMEKGDEKVEELNIYTNSKEVRLLSMKTTYFLTHESINCPICGKLLRESKFYDEVACSDPQCRFNDSHSKDKDENKKG